MWQSADCHRYAFVKEQSMNDCLGTGCLVVLTTQLSEASLSHHKDCPHGTPVATANQLPGSQMQRPKWSCVLFQTSVRVYPCMPSPNPIQCCHIPRHDRRAGQRPINARSTPSSQASSRSDSHMGTAPHAVPLADLQHPRAKLAPGLCSIRGTGTADPASTQLDSRSNTH